MTRLRVHLAQLVNHLASRVFTPLCPGGCRQPIDRCACRWIPPLTEE